VPEGSLYVLSPIAAYYTSIDMSIYTSMQHDMIEAPMRVPQ